MTNLVWARYLTISSLADQREHAIIRIGHDQINYLVAALRAINWILTTIDMTLLMSVELVMASSHRVVVGLNSRIPLSRQ